MFPCNRIAAILATVLLAFGAAAGGAELFDVRMVKVGGDPGDPATRDHIEYCRRIGFNAVWVYSSAAGRWSPEQARRGPRLEEAFVDLARWCRDRDVRVFVSLNPHADTYGAILYSDPRYERRIRKFLRLLRRKAGVRDVVISFDDQPTELTDLTDIVRYGRSTAPAHLDLVRRIEKGIPPDDRVWMCAAAYCDAHLGDGTGPYTSALLSGLDTLPDRVGLVWTGPTAIPPEIRREGMAATRRRLGGRKLLLYDNYPANGDGDSSGVALVLGPLRGRDADLAAEAAAYLACPMTQLGASRLPLRTVADWLAEPESYDPDASWREAQQELAGENSDARNALRVQAMEWGGWIGTPNYRPTHRESVYTLVNDLDVGHVAASLEWVVRRYPERMAALEEMQDERFRSDLLEMMARRLAIARAFPLVREYRARRDVGRSDLEPIREALADLWRDQTAAGARRILSRFYLASGIDVPGTEEAEAPAQSTGAEN